MEWTGSFFAERRGPREQQPPRPPWAVPEDELPAPVALRVLLGKSQKAAAAIVDGSAYSTGFELRVMLMTRHQGPMTAGVMHPRPSPTGALSEEFFRFGVGFADGRRASNVELVGETHRRWFEAQREGREFELPEGPILLPTGGSGGSRRFVWSFFAWPLPPPGPLTFACEWPLMGIAETLHAVDADPILAAARQAEKLW